MRKDSHSHFALHHRWDICDAEFLRYKTMHAYDRAMIHLEKVRRVGDLP